ncbi:hypothetical protein B5P40_30270 [Bacillus sp. SRB_8]|nr:hypothetical protein B5P40_30270 [Bacillus sp. SRB_8]
MATKIISFLNCFPLKYLICDSPRSVLKKFSLLLKTLQQNLKYVGSGIFGDIKEEKLTQEEIMNFAVEMREKKQKDTTIH